MNDNLRSQKVGIVLAGDLAGEILGRKLVFVALGSLGSEIVGHLLEKLERIGLVDLLAL